MCIETMVCHPNEGLFAMVTENAVSRWSSAANPSGMVGVAWSFSSEAASHPGVVQ